MPHAETRKMVDRARFAQMRRHRIDVAHVGDLQGHILRQHIGDVLALPVDQVIDNHDAFAARGQLAHQLRADEPGAAGHHHLRSFRHQPRRPSTRNATRLTGPKSWSCTASCAAVRLIAESYTGDSGATAIGWTMRETKS